MGSFRKELHSKVNRQEKMDLELNGVRYYYIPIRLHLPALNLLTRKEFKYLVPQEFLYQQIPRNLKLQNALLCHHRYYRP